MAKSKDKSLTEPVKGIVNGFVPPPPLTEPDR